MILLLTAGTAAETGEQLFRIEFTAYENNTITYLHADTTTGSTYVPYTEKIATETYDFEFYDAAGNLITTHGIPIYFAEHSMFPNQDQPTKTSTHVQLPLHADATQLRITRQGTELASTDLVNAICSPQTSDNTCNQDCKQHGADPDCEGTSPLLLILGVVLVVGLIGGVILYRRRKAENDIDITF